MISRKVSKGCWTCRVRRKKCDEARPVCSVCTSLQIDCLYSNSKPEWMDGGHKQRDRLEEIKKQIRRGSHRKREQEAALKQGKQAGLGRQSFVLGDSSSLSQAGQSGRRLLVDTDKTEEIYGPQQADGTLAPAETSDDTVDAIEKAPTGPVESVFNFLQKSQDSHDFLPLFFRRMDYEVEFLAKYLDCVFPFLFPFYRPGLLETGRGWLLVLLQHSKVAFHSALSLSAYFFSTTMHVEYPVQHGVCKDQLWLQLLKQDETSFAMIKREIAALHQDGDKVNVLSKARLMESIVQLLVFEATLGESSNWTNHLAAAITLFEGLLGTGDCTLGKSCWTALLHGLAEHGRYELSYSQYFWTSDQSGIRFFSAVLIFIDIIGSITLGIAPRLADHHTHLLADKDDSLPDNGIAQIQLSNVIGCQNWVMVALGQTAALDAWKKETRRSGSLSMMEIVEGARQINDTLLEGISRLNAHDTNRIQSSPRRHLLSVSPTFSIVPTMIWAHSVQIYLTVVVSGWQPLNPDIRAGVVRALGLLQTLSSAAHLRAVAWPLCVAGCLAGTTEQEQLFRNLFLIAGDVELVGALGEARRVMQHVWGNRDSLDTSSWDLTSCFKALGHPVLLI